MPRHSRGRTRDPRKIRLLALAGVVAACAVALPLAVASAGPVGSAAPEVAMGGADGPGPATDAARNRVRPSPRGDDKAAAAAVPTRSPLPLGLELSSAVRCGPDLSSPDGIEAQTCLMTQGADTWARTYYRNATGDALHAVLSLMGPGGRTVRMHCAVGAEDEPGMCETPREETRGDLAAYTAVAEFARRAGRGPLLLRSGSNLPAETGS